MAVLIFKQGNFTETGSLAYAEPIFFTDANTLIISGGVSTYANTEVSPSIPVGRVGYRVATIDAINTGSFLVTGDVSASNLLLDGNATIRGNITMGGSGLDFGDASDDNVVFKADISSSILPNNDDSFDLGSDSQRWKNGYLSNLNLSGSLFVDGGPIDLHSDTYISASAGTFLDIDITGNTTFDGQGTLSVSSSGALKIDSPTSIGIGTNSDAPITVQSTTLDVDASGALTLDSATSISIGTNADKPIDIDSTTLDIDASGALTIDSSATTLVSTGSIYVNSRASTLALSSSGDLSIDSETSIKIGNEQDVLLDIHSARLDLDATGKITIDSSHVDGIQIGTAIDRPFKVESSTFDIDSSGAITINGESTTAISSSGALSIDSETGINIGTTTDKPIDIDSTTLDIDASGAVTLDSTSTISLDGVGNSNFTIDSGNLTINNTTSGNMTLQSAGAIDIDADGGKVTIDGSGGIDIGVESDVAIDIDSSTLDIDASGAITIDGTSTLSIDVDGATNINTSVGGIEINSEAGSLTLDGHTGVDIDASNSGKVAIDGAGGIDIGVAADTAIDIDASTLDIDASGALTIDSATSIGIGTNDDKPIDIDSTTFDLDATGNITLDSATGINIGTATSGVPISIGHTTSTTTINDDLTVTGNFTVNGTTTYVSSSNVTIGDRIIELNYLGASGNGGIYVGDADGTATSGSLLWDTTNDNWIAGQKDLEHKILLENGDSIISGSGANNKIAIFTGTHGLDSSNNLGFDGSILSVTGTTNLKGSISGSASASFADLIVTDDASIASLNVTDLTNDRVVIVGGGGEIEDSANLTFNGSTLGITGNVTATASGSFKDVKVTDNVTVDGVVRAERLNVTSSENILATFESTDAAAKIVLKDVNGEGARFSYLGSTDTVGIGQSNTHNEMSIHINDNERVAIGSNHTIPHGVLDVSGSLIVSGTQEIKFGDLTVHETGSFGRVSGHILATNGVISGSIQVFGGSGVVSGSSQIDHDATTNFVANEHIDHSSVSITAGTGLNGGGDLTSTRTLNVDDDYKNTSLNAATGSYLTSSGSVAFSDITSKPSYLVGNLVPGNNVTITSGSDTLTIEASAGGGGGGTISGSSQIAHAATTNFVAGEHFLQSAITTVGTVTTGNVQAILPSGTISGSSQINHDSTTGFVANEHIDHSSISVGSGKGLDGGGTIDTSRSIFLDTGSSHFDDGIKKIMDGDSVLSGSLLPGSNVTINSSSDGFFISSSAPGGGANDATITLTAGSGLDGGGAFTVNQSGNETITFTVGDGVVSGSAQIDGSALGSNKTITISGTSVTLGGSISDETLFGGTGVISGSAGISKTLQDVTNEGSSSINALTVGDGTNSTSKTTGALIVSGGLGVLNTINAGGDVIAFASSDERLKDNIKPIENPLEVISQISGNTFDWNSEKQNIYNGKDYGVIAQEIQKVMPELVDTRDSGYLAVKYDKIVPLLIESIKELKREIEELKSK